MLNKNIFNTHCADYLRKLGINATDGEGINCPYRPTADSESFVVNGPTYYDHSHGEGGGVWSLALKMHQDNKRQALESLHKAAGVPFMPGNYEKQERALDAKERALNALKKVSKEFCIDPTHTPQDVIDYLNSRKVGDKSKHLFAYIPDGKLDEVLSNEEMELTGLRYRQGQIIMWYFKYDQPVYYVTRKIGEKAFKKAACNDGILEHPIWNHDALYTKENVVWAEGMFDCASLIELGYGVAGELTCHLIKKHEKEFISAIRWRKKYHPEWNFTICLDNDEPDSNGRRAGNEAAEKIALLLWANGLDVKWVKHNPADSKVDINQLHQNGLESHIHNVISQAKITSELLSGDEEFCFIVLTKMLNNNDVKGVGNILDYISDKFPEEACATKVIKSLTSIRQDWKQIYTKEISDLFLYGKNIYVIYKERNRYEGCTKDHEIFCKTDLCDNLRKHQINPNLKLKYDNLDIDGLTPYWRISKEPRHSEYGFNLFSPSPMLTQDVDPNNPVALPSQWNFLLNNIAGPDEKEWLLNHMAYYVQTLEKPRTIPVLLGGQGTGKTTLASLFGEAIGSFSTVNANQAESSFNEFMLHAVVLLDELSTNRHDSNRLKNIMKSMINERVTINEKHIKAYTAHLNNYIIIASNEHTAYVPIVIERDDRRYTIVCGGDNRDLAKVSEFCYDKLKEELPMFMKYLLQYNADGHMANVPLENEAKKEIKGLSVDMPVAVVDQYLDDECADLLEPRKLKVSKIVADIKENRTLSTQLTCKSIIPILKELGYECQKQHGQNIIELEPISNVDA